MSRKSIFDRLANAQNIKSDAIRINQLFIKENMFVVGILGFNYTMKTYVDEKYFEYWKNKGHCIDMDDFLETIGYNDILLDARFGDVNGFLTLIEVVFNFWKMVEINLDKEGCEIQSFSKFYRLHDIMAECLSRLNHKAIYIAEEEKIIVIEDKPEVTAVADIVDSDISYDVIKYNHHSLKGKIELKKSILLKLSNELEPKRKELKTINKTLEDDIFYMFNNLNIRHNNRSKNDSKYKEHIAKMRKNKLEKWYDDLYQMVLLAFLLLDNKDRAAKVKELRNEIEGENEKCEQR